MGQPAEPPIPAGEPGSPAAATVSGDEAAEGSGTALGRMPDFFLVGHEKCGTTALYRMLRAHPQIFMPDFKEPRFFSPDVRARAPRAEGGFLPRTLEEYLALFADAGPEQRVGEASPQYLRSPSAARSIAELQPDARIIAILREPASFLRSFHHQCVRSGLEDERDMRTALALEAERRQGRRLPPGTESPAWLLYNEHVRYIEQLQRYHAEFPDEQILVLIYEDYRRENIETVRRILRFLQVDDTVEIQPLETQREELTGVRFMPLHRLSRTLRRARYRPAAAGPLARTVGALTPKPLQQLGRRITYTEAPAPDQELMGELRRRLKPEVIALSEYLGRDLVGLWGYDSL